MKFPVQTQPQVQTREVSQVKTQTLAKQKEVIQPPFTKPTTDRSIGQMPDKCKAKGSNSATFY